MTTPHQYNVLLVDLARSFGGAEVRVLAQATALQGQVGKCAVAVLEGSPLHKRLVSLGLPCETLTSGRSSPGLLMGLRRIIRSGPYHVVDAHNVQSILWGHFAAWLAGAPGRVATIHSDYGAEYPGLKGKLYEGVLLVDRLLARQYVNVTEVLQAKSVARGTGNRSVLIHNAVPLPEPLPSGKDPSLLAEWGFAPEDFVVAIIARLKPVKGHIYLIDALARLSDLPKVKLLVAGDGPLGPELQARVSAAGLEDRVHFAGFREDVLHLLPSIDCVCIPSLSEALPYVMLEAASLARPIVATSVGGMATLLENNRTALLVPPADLEALATSLRWLVEHPDRARELGLAARKMVGESFSVDTMIARTLQVYDRTVSHE